jgi:hypothetical protein
MALQPGKMFERRQNIQPLLYIIIFVTELVLVLAHKVPGEVGEDTGGEEVFWDVDIENNDERLRWLWLWVHVHHGPQLDSQSELFDWLSGFAGLLGALGDFGCDRFQDSGLGFVAAVASGSRASDHRVWDHDDEDKDDLGEDVEDDIVVGASCGGV